MNRDPLYAALGERILAARRRAKLSQEQLARRVNLTRTSITNIERGRQRLQVHTLYAIAEELGVRPHALLPALGLEAPTQIEERLPESLPPDAVQWVQRVVAKGGR